MSLVHGCVQEKCIEKIKIEHKKLPCISRNIEKVPCKYEAEISRITEKNNHQDETQERLDKTLVRVESKLDNLIMWGLITAAGLALGLTTNILLKV